MILEFRKIKAQPENLSELRIADWMKIGFLISNLAIRNSPCSTGRDDVTRSSDVASNRQSEIRNSDTWKEMPQRLVDAQATILSGDKASLLYHRGLHILDRIGWAGQETGKSEI